MSKAYQNSRTRSKIIIFYDFFSHSKRIQTVRRYRPSMISRSLIIDEENNSHL